MATVERTRKIAAEPARVWKELADFGAIATWAPNVDHSCLMSEQEHDVGVVRRIQTGRTTVLETVRSWEPESELSYTITGLPAVIRSVVSTWRLEPQGAGTLVTLTSEADAGPRPPQKAIAKVAGRRLASTADEMLDGLAAHLAKETQ